MSNTSKDFNVCTNCASTPKGTQLPPCAKPGQICTKHDLERLEPKYQRFSIDGDPGCKYGDFSFDGDYVCHARKK